MDSSLIGKVEKSKRYALEQDRITFTTFVVRFQGDHLTHEVTFRDGAWKCTCDYFDRHRTCSHTMAMERVLVEMLPINPSLTSR